MPDGNLIAWLELFAIFATVAAVLTALVHLGKKAIDKDRRQMKADEFRERVRALPLWKRITFYVGTLSLLLLLFVYSVANRVSVLRIFD